MKKNLKEKIFNIFLFKNRKMAESIFVLYLICIFLGSIFLYIFNKNYIIWFIWGLIGNVILIYVLLISKIKYNW